MTNDMINASFEMMGALFVLLNCLAVYRDKEIKGVSILTVMFFSSWSMWNIYFYGSLDQPLSAIASFIMACGQAVYTGQVIYYNFFYKRIINDTQL